jgi:hypothetical protein
LGDEAQGPQRGFSARRVGRSTSTPISIHSCFGWLNLSFPNNEQVTVEEAYLQTTSLGEGLTLKAGEFFSGIAYLNEQHAHNWSFSDASLPYRVFLNGNMATRAYRRAGWRQPTSSSNSAPKHFAATRSPSGGAANNGVGTETFFVHTATTSMSRARGCWVCPICTPTATDAKRREAIFSPAATIWAS